MNETATTVANPVSELLSKSGSHFLLIPVFQWLDIATTWLGINVLGMTEANPLIAGIAGSSGWAFMYFGTSILMFRMIKVDLLAGNMNNKGVRIAYGIVLFAYVITIINNSLIVIFGGW